jgi:hypothetical protein
MRCASSVCASGYIVHRDLALKALQMAPFRQPIDWHLNRVKAEYNLTFYQFWPPLMRQTESYSWV